MPKPHAEVLIDVRNQLGEYVQFRQRMGERAQANSAPCP